MKKHTFSEAVAKLEEPEVIEIAGRLKQVADELEGLWKQINQAVPLETGYSWALFGKDNRLLPYYTGASNEETN
jgi:hypothetical protein